MSILATHGRFITLTKTVISTKLS